jgi:hypothetical protein
MQNVSRTSAFGKLFYSERSIRSEWRTSSNASATALDRGLRSTPCCFVQAPRLAPGFPYARVLAAPLLVRHIFERPRTSVTLEAEANLVDSG